MNLKLFKESNLNYCTIKNIAVCRTKNTNTHIHPYIWYIMGGTQTKDI